MSSSSRKRSSRWGQAGDDNEPGAVPPAVSGDMPSDPKRQAMEAAARLAAAAAGAAPDAAQASAPADPKRLAMEAAARLAASLPPTAAEPSTSEAKRLALEAAARLSSALAPPPVAEATGVVPGAPIYKDDLAIEKMGINHLSGSKRYRLTKRATMDEVMAKYGVAITAKGVFQAPEVPVDPNVEPLYLEFSGTSLSAVASAKQHMRELSMLEDDNESEAGFVGKVPVGISAESPFHVVARVVGTGGENLKHIRRTANSNIMITGKGSGGRPEDINEELHLRIESRSAESLAKATQLCEDLLAHIHEQFKEWTARRPPPPPPPPRVPVPQAMFAPPMTVEQQQYLLYQQMYMQQMGQAAAYYGAAPPQPPPPQPARPAGPPPPPPPPPPGVGMK